MQTTKEPLSISFPSWLIEVVNAYCLKHDLAVSQLVVRATRRYILQKLDDPDFWNQFYNKTFDE